VTEKTADVLGTESMSQVPFAGSAPKRMVDRWNPRLINVLTLIGFAAPVIAYFWMLHHYSLNVVVGDQWDDVTVIERAYSHFPNWSSLWAPHNENRIFFPNLVVLFLAYTTRFNIQVEEYLSAVILCAATVFLIWSHKRRSPSTPWLYYCPVAWISLSIVQYGNTLWGFQLAWYLVLLSLASAIVLLDRINLTLLVFVGAVTVAVVGSYSSFQGLFIWPVGAVLLYHRRRHPAFILTWIVAAATTFIIYFHNFNISAAAPGTGSIWHEPLKAIRFFLFAVGDIVGFQNPGPNNYAVPLFGLIIVILAIIILVTYGIRRDELGGSPIGVGLICFGLLFALSITDARLIFGLGGASQSRYTTFDLLIPLGVYLALLGRPTIAAGKNRWHPMDRALPLSRTLSWSFRKIVPVARWILAAVFVLQIGLGLHYAVGGIRYDYSYDIDAGQVLANIQHEPNNLVEYYLYLFKSPSFIRERARFLEIHHLSLFADP
jgi:hypothetical protein